MQWLVLLNPKQTVPRSLSPTLTLSSLSTEWPVWRDMILSSASFCASTSRHLIAISIACRWPVGGTRGCCSMAARAHPNPV